MKLAARGEKGGRALLREAGSHGRSKAIYMYIRAESLKVRFPEPEGLRAKQRKIRTGGDGRYI